jgi:hypothetical protein
LHIEKAKSDSFVLQFVLQMKALGLPDMLQTIEAIAGDLHNLDDVTAARGEKLGEKLAKLIVDCLSSSKTETRAAATSLMDVCISSGCVSPDSFRKALGRLKPALQRSVAPLIEKHAKKVPSRAVTEESSIQEVIPPEKSIAKLSLAKLTTKGGATTMTMDEDRALDAESTSKHPFSSSERARKSAKLPFWPEYPEEPNAQSFEELNKVWGTLLPLDSSSRLFPRTGVKKQDDAKEGCDVLIEAITADRAAGSKMVIEHLGFVLRWLDYVFCTRESPNGLNGLLVVAKDLFSFLVEQCYSLKEEDTLIVLPRLIEKASTAKVSNVTWNRLRVSDPTSLLIGEVPTDIPRCFAYTSQRRGYSDQRLRSLWMRPRY